ncbi:hypothetical protein, partial [Klebsiella pneumoniae]|uniref:hypothetical protein n=1 Tax=Klebsiella pneumoniae TaxID=573 RepID=UPI00301371B0
PFQSFVETIFNPNPSPSLVSLPSISSPTFQSDGNLFHRNFFLLSPPIWAAVCPIGEALAL